MIKNKKIRNTHGIIYRPFSIILPDDSTSKCKSVTERNLYGEFMLQVAYIVGNDITGKVPEGLSPTIPLNFFSRFRRINFWSRIL